MANQQHMHITDQVNLRRHDTHIIESVVLFMFVFLFSNASAAQTATITTNHDSRCIHANGLPDHSTGTFPNKGNPHRIQVQNIRYCFALAPRKNTKAIYQPGSIGVALNGITIRPGTADYWDSQSSRGHSRNSASGWNLEGLGSRDTLGIDHNNAHVDNRGLYHYHGVAKALVASTQQHGSLIGYAADGFEIHYTGDRQQSSYRLKNGTRPSGPGGRYDGTYNEDWEYIANSGTLDQCNGGTLNGKFVYFATDNYPFFPRCLWGTASADFRTGGSHHPQASHSASRHKHTGLTNRKGPPKAAIAACASQSVNAACSFHSPRHTIEGHCRMVPSGQLTCVPKRHH